MSSVQGLAPNNAVHRTPLTADVGHHEGDAAVRPSSECFGKEVGKMNSLDRGDVEPVSKLIRALAWFCSFLSVC